MAVHRQMSRNPLRAPYPIAGISARLEYDSLIVTHTRGNGCCPCRANALPLRPEGRSPSRLLVAADVCAILDIKNVSDACDRLDADEKYTLAFDEGIPGNPLHLTVNEPGLYKLLFRSNKPEAKRFTRWVTHDVLPTLRRTGQYHMPHEPRQRRSLDAPKEMTVGLVLCFWAVYERPTIWWTTTTLAARAGVSVRRVRDYCRYLSEQAIFERIHLHPSKLYRWHPEAVQTSAALVQTLHQAKGALPRDLPQLDKPIWEKESDPRLW